MTNIQPRALELWSQFKEVQFGVSIDGIGAPLEYIRNPIKSSLMEKNLRRLDEAGAASHNFRVWLAFTVGALNAFHFTDFIKWKIEQDYTIISPMVKGNPKPFINAHPIHGPNHLSIRFLPPEVKDMVRDKWEAFRTEFKESIVHTIDFEDIYNRTHMADKRIKMADVAWACEKLDQLIDSNIKFMYGEDWFTEENNRLFWEYNNKLDSIRGESLETSIPELYEAMKKYDPSR